MVKNHFQTQAIKDSSYQPLFYTASNRTLYLHFSNEYLLSLLRVINGMIWDLLLKVRKEGYKKTRSSFQMKSCNMTTKGGEIIYFLKIFLFMVWKKIFLTNQVSLFQGYAYVSMIVHYSLVLVKFFWIKFFVTL